MTAELLPTARIGNSPRLRGRSPALLCGRYFLLSGVLIRKVFGGFLGVVDRVVTVSCGNFRIERGLLVISCFVVLCRFAMMLRCEFVMFGCLLVVLRTLLSCHLFYSSLTPPLVCQAAGNSIEPRRPSGCALLTRNGGLPLMCIRREAGA